MAEVARNRTVACVREAVRERLDLFRSDEGVARDRSTGHVSADAVGHWRPIGGRGRRSAKVVVVHRSEQRDRAAWVGLRPFAKVTKVALDPVGHARVPRHAVFVATSGSLAPLPSDQSLPASVSKEPDLARQARGSRPVGKLRIGQQGFANHVIVREHPRRGGERSGDDEGSDHPFAHERCKSERHHPS